MLFSYTLSLSTNDTLINYVHGSDSRRGTEGCFPIYDDGSNKKKLNSNI